MRQIRKLQPKKEPREPKSVVRTKILNQVESVYNELYVGFLIYFTTFYKIKI